MVPLCLINYVEFRSAAISIAVHNKLFISYNLVFIVELLSIRIKEKAIDGMKSGKWKV